MNKDDKIYIAGLHGMVGSAIARALRAEGFTRIYGHKSRDLDLRDAGKVTACFQKLRPDYVFLAAARVGGIYANNTYPGDFIHSNLCIQTNVIHAASQANVRRLLFLGSSCIYPRDAKQPMKEEALLTGPLEKTNEPYAIAKIAGIKMCEAYNRQYKTDFITCMPTNLYGPFDNYDLENAHVLPALLRKVHEAKVKKAKNFTVWGSGSPKREFLYVDDLANACLFLMENYKGEGPINIGSGEEVPIKNLVYMIQNTVGFRGDMVFDATKPDGTPRKLLDSSRIREMGWRPKYSLGYGLDKTYEAYVRGEARGLF